MILLALVAAASVAHTPPTERSPSKPLARSAQTAAGVKPPTSNVRPAIASGAPIPSAGVLNEANLISLMQAYSKSKAAMDQFSALPGDEYVGRSFSAILTTSMKEESYDRDTGTLTLTVLGLYCLPLQTQVAYQGQKTGQTALGASAKYQTGSAETLGIGWGEPAYQYRFQLPLAAEEARALSKTYRVRVSGVIEKGKGLYGQQERELVSTVTSDTAPTLANRYEAKQTFRWVNVRVQKVELLGSSDGPVLRELDVTSRDPTLLIK